MEARSQYSISTAAMVMARQTTFSSVRARKPYLKFLLAIKSGLMKY